jgi:hypothetical protein
LRGDIVWTQADQIPGTAQVVANVTQGYLTTSRIECTADNTVPTISGIYPTWLTNLQYWIPQEFGSTWPVKVWVDTAGAANPTVTGTQIFAPGIGGVGEFFFDTQAGVLNFIGETIPTVLTAGNVVYISGYEYIGAIGVTNQPGNVSIGNLQISNTTITTDGTVANIVIQPTGNGIVSIDTTTGLILPVGNTAQRPNPASEGTMRFNSDNLRVEVYDGTEWDQIVSGVTNQSFNGDGSTVAFTLDRSTTSAAALIMLNGVTQLPGTAYNISPNPSVNLIFTEAPSVSDVIDIRFL